MKQEKTLDDHIKFLKEGSLMTRRLQGATTKMIWVSLKVSEDNCSAEVRPSQMIKIPCVSQCKSTLEDEHYFPNALEI
jgi:hypothetical protein